MPTDVPTDAPAAPSGPTTTPGRPVLAIDVGGTKVALALVGADGTILTETRVPTAASPDATVVWAPVGAAIERLVTDATGSGLIAAGGTLDVGIGSAGPIDGPAGTVSPVNIGAWRDFGLRDHVLEAVGRPAESGRPGPGAARALLAGDGHCIALGEHWLGAGRDVASMIGLVISTGVGGGAVIDDRLFTGTTGNAVHVGHTSVNAWGERCVCGCHGCVEMYARGPALVAAAQARGWTGTDGEALTASAAAGDPVAVEVIDHGMRAAAAGIAATVTQLDVDVVVVGGGLSKAGPVVFEPLRRHLRDFATLSFAADVELRPAELPNAGLLGAASLALSLSGRGPLRPGTMEVASPD